MKDVLIVANGEFLSKNILQEVIKDKTVIALDGAAVRLAAMGTTPDIILGDFDSLPVPNPFGINRTFSDLSETDSPYINDNNILIVPTKDQKHTDLTKAILYCDQQNASSITIVCALGGRLDHHEGTLRNLRRFYKKDRLILVHSSLQTMRFAKDETVTFSGEIGDKCGVLAFPQASFSSHGLVYEANQFPLEFAYSENICNALAKEQVNVSISGEALLVMPPFLIAQRNPDLKP